MSVYTSLGLTAQEVEIRVGATNIAKNQYFTITVVVKNGKLTSVSNFPGIKGFQNAGTSSSSSTNIMNGRVSSEYKYIQNYLPMKEGKFTLNPFGMKVNGKNVQCKGTTVTVGPAKQQQQRQTWDPFKDFFGRGSNNQKQEFVDVKEDAFFAVSVDKKECYVGEGITLTLAFYVADKNKAQMDFFKLDEQLKEILSKVKPKNSWEEPFQITQIKPEKLELNGKAYRKFSFYQTRYYPLNAEKLVIPSVGLKMLKYKVSTSRSIFGSNLKEDFKTFYSKAKTIKVNDLPDHPLREVVAVGNYKLNDMTSTKNFESGKSFNYKFKIIGEGNIAGIKEPSVSNTDAVQVFPPNEHSDINRSNGLVTGQKVFDYFLIPNEPGAIDLGNIFEWVYFNTSRKKYDTLRSEIRLEVKGESLMNNKILSKDFGNFYENIKVEDRIVNLNPLYNWFWVIEIAIFGIAILSFAIFYIKK